MKCKPANRHDSAEGFTLIEVLVSVTLLAIVIGAVYSSFFSIQRLTERFDKVSMKYHEARTTLDMIRREIEAALMKQPAFNRTEGARAVFELRDRDIFGKSASALDLTAYSFRGISLNHISYYVKEEEKKLTLVKTEAPLPGLSESYSVELIEGIESFTVETFFDNKWVRTWDTTVTGYMPDEVRVIIEFDDNGKKISLTEYVKPMVGKQI